VKVVVDKLRVDRSQVRLAEVEVGDETGTVSLRARDDQIEVLKEVSERSGAVVLRNCSVELFQGKHVRLAVTKWGKLTPYPDQVASTPPPPSKMNRERNFSLIDISLVASELVEMSPSEAAFSPQVQHRMIANIGLGSRATRPQTSRQQMQRKVTARDRRPQHPKPTGMNPPLPMLYPESGMQGHMGAMRYSGMPGFSPSFGEGRSHQASTQHLLMQQYEMHQRQLQQMQAFHEQERNRPMIQRHHQQGHQMQGPMLGAASFDTTGDYSVPSPVLGSGNPQQSMHLVGNNPMLIRVSMPRGQPSMGTSGQSDHYSSRSGAMMSAQAVGMPQSTHVIGGRPAAFRPYQDPSARGGAFVSTQSESEALSTNARGTTSASDFVSQDDSSLSPGHMNPQATAFSPSYQGMSTSKRG
jgi:replication factor A1